MIVSSQFDESGRGKKVPKFRDKNEHTYRFAEGGEEPA